MEIQNETRRDGTRRDKVEAITSIIEKHQISAAKKTKKRVCDARFCCSREGDRGWEHGAIYQFSPHVDHYT